MELMDVKIMQLRRAVLDDPVFDVTLPDDDVRRVRLRIERLWSFAVRRQKEFGGTIGIAWILLLLGKEKLSHADRRDIADPRPARARQRLGACRQCTAARSLRCSP